jgi:hypothetical protein
MTHGDESTSREDGEKGKMKEEEMKEPGPLDFLSELVQEEDLSPKVATSYRKLMRTMANQFCQEMKSCITFVCAENQVTWDTVTDSHRGDERDSRGVHSDAEGACREDAVRDGEPVDPTLQP